MEILSTWRARFAIKLVRVITAVVITIASPVLEHAPFVGALIFVRLATQKT